MNKTDQLLFDFNEAIRAQAAALRAYDDLRAMYGDISGQIEEMKEVIERASERVDTLGEEYRLLIGKADDAN